MSRQIVAIDIRNNTLAAVVLDTGLKSTSIEACAHTVLPPADDENESRLSAGLTTLLETLNINNTATVLSLPSDLTIYRTIEVPFTDDKKIRQVLPFELEPSLPVDVGNLIIDYQKTDQPADGLLTVAIDQQAMADVLADFESNGLHPQLVLPGDYPLASILATSYEGLEDHALLITTGAAKATLFALKSRSIALVRSLPADITGEAGVEAFALKVRQTLTAYTNAITDDFSPETVYLSGPAFSDETAGQRLSEALELPATIVNLREMVPKVESAGALHDWAPHLYDSALAIAMIEVEGRTCPNFHRSGSAIRNYWSNYGPYVRGPATLLAIVLLLALGSVMVESHLLNNRLDKINAQIEDVFTSTLIGVKRIKGIDALDQMKSEVKKLQGGGIDAGENGPGTRIIDVLYHLSNLIPKDVDVKLDRLVMGKDGIDVSGETAEYSVVDDVKNRLESNEFFKSVTIASTTKDKSGKMVRFKLKIEP